MSWKWNTSFKTKNGDVISLDLRRQSQQTQITIAEAWELFRPTSKRCTSWKDDLGRSKQLIKHIGTVKISELTLDTVELYRDARMKELTPRGTTIKPSTLNHEVKLIRRIINHMLRTNRLEKSPLRGLKLLRENNVRYSVINEEQLEALLSVAHKNLQPLIVLAYDTGMRRGELFGLKWSFVDLRDKAIFLPETKNDHARTVFLTDRAQKTLNELPRSKSGYVLVNPRTDRPWTDIKKMWHNARTAAGMKDVWFHDLRRSYITNARRRGVQESVIMKLSGHRTRHVFDRYNIVSTNDLKKAVELIEVGRHREIIHDQTA